MTMSIQLLTLLQLVAISFVINNDSQVSAAIPNAIPNVDQLKELVRFLKLDFTTGELIKRGRQQFAVALLLPDMNTQWRDFSYSPSQNNDGQTPVINPIYPISPPDLTTLNNYIAARPNEGHHSEMQLLAHMNDLYNAFIIRNRKLPQALLLYSFIVPCKTCTNAIVNVLTNTRAPFNDIPIKVVAYTTKGTNCRNSDCDVDYTVNMLSNHGIGVIHVRTREEELIKSLLDQLMTE